MYSGSEACAPSKGLVLMNGLPKTSSSTGAVSPAIRATASMTPVVMPPMAVGRTTFRMVRHFGMPSAREASRSSFGTSLSISSVERTTTGIIRIARASEPAKPERLHAEHQDPELRMNRPATIDGMPRHDVDEEGDGPGELAAAVLDQVDAVSRPIGAAISGGEADLLQGADDARGRCRRPARCRRRTPIEWVRK